MRLKGWKIKQYLYVEWKFKLNYKRNKYFWTKTSAYATNQTSYFLPN